MPKLILSRKLKLLLKICVSVIAIGYLAQSLSINEILQNLSHINFLYGTAIFVLVVGGMYLQSERWRRLIILPNHEKPSSFDFFRYTTIGFFFNLFLPTGFGGDAVRSIGLGKTFQITGKSVASTIISRILGLQTLVLFMLLGSYFVDTNIPSHIVVSLQLCGLGFIIASCLFWGIIFSTKFQRLSVPQKIRSRISFVASLFEYKDEPTLFLKAFFDSILLQIVILATNWLMFLALNLPMPIEYILAIFPMVTLATMIPVSFFGIGLREWAALSLYTFVPGLTNNDIMSALMLGYAYMLLQAFAGLFFWLQSKSPKT